MKKIITFILSIALLSVITPCASAKVSIRLDEQKIKILQEYAMRIPYFYGDEVHSEEFARKVIAYLYRGYGYRSGFQKGYLKNVPVIYLAEIVPEANVNSEYKLIFNTDIPKNTRIENMCISWDGECVYDKEFTKNEYKNQYIIQTGDCPDDIFLYKSSVEDGNGGLYVTVDMTDYEGIVYGSSVLHIVPCNNEIGFALVSHTPYIPERNINIQINGQQIPCDYKPVMINDTVLVPMRSIFEAFNSSVVYDSDFKNFKHIITAINSNGMLQLKYDENRQSTYYYDNSVYYSHNRSHWSIYYTPQNGTCREIYFGTAPTIENGRTLVPVRVIAETLGAYVSWDGNTKTVIINGTIPEKWSKADKTEKMNNMSYNNLLDIVNGYFDKNAIIPKDSLDIWDFEHGKGLLTGYDKDGKSYGLIYYYDGNMKKTEEITFSQAQLLGKEAMQKEHLQNKDFNNDFMWDWNTYYKYENGQYWSENDNEYLIGYYGGGCWTAYVINKYTKQIRDAGSYQDLCADAIPGFHIDLK